MNIKTIFQTLTLSLFILSCSTDTSEEAIEDNASYILIENQQDSRAGNWLSGEIPENPLWFDVTYIEGLSPQQKHQLRTEYAAFVGLTSVFLGGNNTETWIVDEEIYNEYCEPCVILNKCCKTEVVEEDDEIEEVELKTLFFNGPK